MDKLEVWKDIKGYEGLYQVSNLGNVRSKKRNINLKLFATNNNYLRVILSKNNKKITYLVHRLVAQAFIPNIENKSCVNHIDCDRKNNFVENLEWCSYSENTKYMDKMNRRKANKHLTNEEVEIIKCKKENKEKRKEVWQQYKDKITLKGFEKIWYGQTWN